MFKNSTVLFSVGIIIITGLVSQASAECLSAKGKITNNAQPGGNTQGVVALNLGNDKYKCALIGEAQPQIPGGPNFLHKAVCDDKASPGTAQAQVTFETRFLANPADSITGFCPEGNLWGPVSFSFEEISTPIPSSARGEFSEVTDQGSIIITGDYNCDGGITMNFDGEICFAE
mgnify:CR=1 FL=1